MLTTGKWAEMAFCDTYTTILNWHVRQPTYWIHHVTKHTTKPYNFFFHFIKQLLMNMATDFSSSHATMVEFVCLYATCLIGQVYSRRNVLQNCWEQSASILYYCYQESFHIYGTKYLLLRDWVLSDIVFPSDKHTRLCICFLYADSTYVNWIS